MCATLTWLPQPSRASRSPSMSASTSSGTSGGTALVLRLVTRSLMRVLSSAEVAAPHPCSSALPIRYLHPRSYPPAIPNPFPQAGSLPRCPTASHAALLFLSGLGKSVGTRKMGQMWLQAGLCGLRVAGSMPENWTPGLSCPVIDSAYLRHSGNTICYLPQFTLCLVHCI